MKSYKNYQRNFKRKQFAIEAKEISKPKKMSPPRAPTAFITESEDQNEISFSCPDSFKNFKVESPEAESNFLQATDGFIKRWKSGNLNIQAQKFKLEIPQEGESNTS
jgi:hypothetical protein